MDTLLFGYYGHRNTGDDAFLAISAWGAHRFLGGRALLASARSLPQAYGTPVKPLYWSSRSLIRRFQDRWAVGQAKRIVFGGGSNFHSGPRMEYLQRLLQRAGPGPHCAVGVSIGPFRDPGAETACAQLLSRLAFIGVRDAVSYERVRRLAPETRAELTFDLAVLLPDAAGGTLSSVRSRRGLGVALCPYERFVGGDLAREAQRVPLVAQAIRLAHARKPIEEVVLLDFNGHPQYGDASVHAALAAELAGVVPLRHLAYSDDPWQVMQTIAGLRGVLAMRLHAAVFAYRTQTPCMVLGYHEKCQAWARMIGHPENLVSDTTSCDTSALAQGLYTLLTEAPLPTMDVADAIARALRNWTWATEARADAQERVF